VVAAPNSSELTVVAAGIADTGPKRAHNEDAVLVRPDLQLYAVADGAGGPNSGNVASAVGLMTLASFVEATRSDAAARPPLDEFGLYTGARRLSAAVHRANREVVGLAKTTKRSMGSTVCATLFDVALGVMHLAHVGDSRCYRLRADVLELLTVDHSLLQDVLEVRPETDDAYLRQLKIDVATRALGMRSVRVSVRSHEVIPGDTYLLCSDGLRRALGDRSIRQVLTAGAAPRDAVADLVRRAYAAQSEDNVAALVVDCDLAPGSDFARRPRPPPTPPSPIRASSPEILMVEQHEEPDALDTDADFHVLPPESASAELLHAMGTLISNQNPRIRTLRFEACASCGDEVEHEARYCPHCGAEHRR
jgi:protein phosphatase